MRFRQGFTLLEMSIVLVIIAVIMAGGAVTFSANLQQRQLDETNFKIAAIQKALLEYRRTYNRLPCPSYMTNYDPDDSAFGTEATSGSPPTTPITCSSADYAYDLNNNDNSCPATIASGAISYGCVYAGTVPVRAMKLPDDYAFDGWGKRFLYSVDRDFVQTDAFVNTANVATVASINCDGSTSCLNRTPASPVNQRIKITSIGGTTKTNVAAYVLMSFGPNGHGAYGRTIATSSITPAPGNFLATIAPYQIASLDTMHDGWELPVASVTDGEFQIAGGGGGGYAAVPIRLTSGSSNTSELENCDCASGTGVSGNFDNVFVQGPYTPDTSNALNTFDDIVTFATRADLRSALE